MRGPSALPGTRHTPEDVGVPQLDLATLFLACAGLGVGVSLAVLAGIVSARVFFDASREAEDERL